MQPTPYLTHEAMMDFFDKKQTCDYLGISEKTLEKYLSQRKLVGEMRRVGHLDKRVFSKDELDAFKKEREAVVYTPTPSLPSPREALVKTDAPAFDAEDFAEALVEHVPLADMLTLSVVQAARLSGVPVTWLRTAIDDGRLPCARIGRGRRILRAHLDAFVVGLFPKQGKR